MRSHTKSETFSIEVEDYKIAFYTSVFAAALHFTIKKAFRDWKQPVIQTNVILHLQILLDFVCQKERQGDSVIEWKLNWPDTCDDLGKVTPTIKWRKKNKDKQKTALLNFVVQQGGFTCPLRVFLSDTVQTNLVSNQYQQAKRQEKKPVFMRVSEGSEIIPTRS